MAALHCGDCLDIMPTLPDASVDAIIADPPYGTTSCKWDSVIPLAPMWAELKRVIKPRGAIVLFAAQPFTSALVMSNAEWFKYGWVWEKSRPNGFVLAKMQPLRTIEDVVVFGKNGIIYNPQNVIPCRVTQKNSRSSGGNVLRGEISESTGKGNLRTPGSSYTQEFTNYPKQVLSFDSVSKSVHPTQKPVDLLRYLVRTYTNAGETVLDFTMGSGTTGVACAMENRNFIGIELERKYYDIAERRISEAQIDLPLLSMVEA